MVIGLVTLTTFVVLGVAVRRTTDDATWWASAAPVERVAAVMLVLVAAFPHFWRDGPPFRYALVVLGAVYLLFSVEGPSASRPGRAFLPFFFLAALLTAWSFLSASGINIATLVLWVPVVFPLATALNTRVARNPHYAERGGGERLLILALMLFFLGALSHIVFEKDYTLATQEWFFVNASAILWSLLRREYFLAFVAALVGLTGFFNYPAVTYIIVTVVLVVAFVLMKSGSYVRMAASVAIGGILVLLSSGFVGLLSSYFSFAGKDNNIGARTELLNQGLQRVLEHPWFGTQMAGSITVGTIVRGEEMQVPVHNSFVTIAVAGGIVTAAAFVAAMAWLLYRAGQRLQRSNENGTSVLGTCIAVSGVATTLFNPILEGLGFALVFYALLNLSSIEAREAKP